MTVLSELLKKYPNQGSRYNSYPTVSDWDQLLTEAQWISSLCQSIEESESKKQGIALYIHIPFCESLCTYCGCNTRITRSHKGARSYVTTLLHEWNLYVSRLGRRGKPITLSNVYLGGGTPTFFTADEIEELLEGIFSTVQLSHSVEFSVEADPRVTREEHFRTLNRFGFQRLILGVEDFDPRVQDLVNRVQSEEVVKSATDLARQLGFSSIQYNLIYGLPQQTAVSIEMTLESIKRLRPDQIAFYSYTHVPWIKPGQRKFTEMDLPFHDEKQLLYHQGRESLEKMGYREIGMDHFSLETDYLWKSWQEGKVHRNFTGYISQVASPLIALGVSAMGDSWTALMQNEKLLEAYQSRVEADELPLLRGHFLSNEDLSIRNHILNLITRRKTQWTAKEVQGPFFGEVQRELVEIEKDGLVQFSDSSLEITEKGRPFLKNICRIFDARASSRI